MQLSPRSLAAQFLHRAITLALIAMVVPTTATAQPAVQSGEQVALTVGELVNVELRGGRHVIGTVVVRASDKMQIEEPEGKVTAIRYIDIREICDLDQGTSVWIPTTLTRDTRWVKRVVIAAAVAVGFILYVRGGCFGYCVP